MPRKKVEIKPVCGERVLELCKANNIKQAELAKRVPISVQTISKIVNGKANLTEEVARRIVAAVPGYCTVEWLLGFSDYRSENHQFTEILRHELKSGVLLRDGLRCFAALTGYEISAPVFDSNGNEIQGYKITKDGSTSILTSDEMARFEIEVCDFVELKLKHLISSNQQEGCE